MGFFEKPKFDSEMYEDKKSSLDDEQQFLDKFYTYRHEMDKSMRRKIEEETIAKIRKLRGEVENLQELANKEVEQNIFEYNQKRDVTLRVLYDLWKFRNQKISTSIDPEKDLKDFISKSNQLF